MYVSMLKYCHLCTVLHKTFVHVLYIVVHDTRFYIPNTYSKSENGIKCKLITLFCSDAGRWKFFWVPVVKGGQNLSLVGIGLTDLSNIWGTSSPPTHSQFGHYFYSNLYGCTPRGPRGVKKSEFFFHK
jgi:hypothetical protein